MADMNNSSDEMSDYEDEDCVDLSLNAEKSYQDNDELLLEDADQSYEDFEVVYVADEKKMGELQESVEFADSASFEERFKDKPHPFLIPEIVKQLGFYLDVKNREALRQVHTTWNDELSNVLRKTRVIEFIDADSVGRYVRRMSKTRKFPHVMFDLMQEDIADGEMNMSEFYRKFGREVKALTFGQLSLNGSSLLEALTTKLPNLESLKLFNHPKRLCPSPQPPLPGPSTAPPPPPEEFPQLPNLKSVQFHVRGAHSQPFIKDLLKIAPNLVKISHIRTCNGPEPDLETVSRGSILMNTILESEEPILHLAVPDFRFTLSESMTELFQKKSFPLVKLDFVMEKKLKESNLNLLIDSLRTTLIQLEITFTHSATLFRFNNGTSLSCIRSLTLRQYRGNMMFVQDMPELENLYLDVPNLADAFPRMGFLKDLGPTGHKLSTFRCQSNASDDLVIRKIAACFPNIKELTLSNVTDEGLNVIYRDLPFITKLSLVSGTFTDSGVSGVSSEVLGDLWNTQTHQVSKPEQFRDNLFLGCLTNLYSVNLESDVMTDLAVIFGLTGCRKLRSLTLKSKELTDLSLETIARSLRDYLIYVDMVGCPGVTESGEFVFRQKQPSVKFIREVFPTPSQGRYHRRMVSSDFTERDDRQRFQVFRLGDHDLPFEMFHAHPRNYVRIREALAARRMAMPHRHPGVQGGAAVAGGAGAGGNAFANVHINDPLRGAFANFPDGVNFIDEEELDMLEMGFMHPRAIARLRADARAEDFIRRYARGGDAVAGPRDAWDGGPENNNNNNNNNNEGLLAPPVDFEFANDDNNNNDELNLPEDPMGGLNDGDIVMDGLFDIVDGPVDGIPPTPPPFL